MNPENYTCLEDKKLYLPKSGLHPIHTKELIPPKYSVSCEKKRRSIIEKLFFYDLGTTCLYE